MKEPRLPASEIISGHACIEHVRMSGVSVRATRLLFERTDISWPEFLEKGVSVAKLRSLDDALANRIADAAVIAAKPIETPTGEIRVYHRHIRAADICMNGSREFFKKHDLNWSDFLSNGIPVSRLQEIGDPIALRAAEQAIEEENRGRR